MPTSLLAARVAAIVERAKKIAAEMMEVVAEDLAYENGRFVVPGTKIPPLTLPRSREWRIRAMSCLME